VPEIAATIEPQSTRQPPTTAPTATPSFVTEVLSFGEPGTGAGAFDDPRHIAVDGEGNIYIGEWSAHRVQVFDSEGDFVTQFSVGENDAILVAMAVDRAGAVFAVAGGRLYHYDGATGELLGQIEYGGANDFDDVVVTADDGLLTSWSSAREESIIRFDPSFDVDLELTGPIAAVAGDTELDMQLAVDGGGTIYALGTFHDMVYRFSPDGVFQSQFGGDGDEPGMFTAPSAITVDRQSRVYVSDFKGIQVFDANGRYLDVFDVPDRGFVHGMTVDDENFLYAVSNNSKVYKFALNP
jgi:streptogramin lyase